MRQINFLRMAKWAKNPPGAAQIKLWLVVIALCFALFAIERWVGWPDFLTVQGGGRLLR